MKDNWDFIGQCAVFLLFCFAVWIGMVALFLSDLGK